jgi:hypothetical protein
MQAKIFLFVSKIPEEKRLGLGTYHFKKLKCPGVKKLIH